MERAGTGGGIVGRPRPPLVTRFSNPHLTPFPEVPVSDEGLDLLEERLDTYARSIEVDAKRERSAELEELMSSPGFWDDNEAAQRVIDEHNAIKAQVEPYLEMHASLDACRELLELADDEDSRAEIDQEIARLERDYEKLELKLALSGPYDKGNVYLSIQPGAGGVEACDWAQMLLRMYLAYFQNAGYTCETIEVLPGEEAGLKSCTLHVSGPMAYGYLKSEMGTHRLVRMSPFNAQGKRQTSFTAVEVTPELPESEAIEINEKDLRIDTYKASGAGGQHVNKTDSAVRLTHEPTGVVAACQNERSQQQNKQMALRMLAAKLQQLEEVERLEELRDLQGERGTIGWGHQIRSYVLQPTQLVTDLRSRHKEGNAEAVLDGDLQPFIDSYLRWRLHGEMAG